MAHPGSVLQSAQGELAAMQGLAESKVIIGKAQRESEGTCVATPVLRDGEVDDCTGPLLQLCNQITMLIYKVQSAKSHGPELWNIHIGRIVLSSREFRLVVWAKEIQTPPLTTSPSNRNCASDIQSSNPAFPGKPLLHMQHKYFFLLSMPRIRACPDAGYRH